MLNKEFYNMNNNTIKYFKAEISFLVPDCSGKNKDECSVCSWAEEQGFVCTVSDAPSSGRWVTLSVPSNNKKTGNMAIIFKKIVGSCIKCKG